MPVPELERNQIICPSTQKYPTKFTSDYRSEAYLDVFHVLMRGNKGHDQTGPKF